MELETPPPFMEKNILNFDFDYLTPSHRSTAQYIRRILGSFLIRTSQQGDINCSILPSGMGGKEEFERKFKKKIILNEVKMRGRATINVTLPHSQTGWTTLYGKCEQGGKLRNEV